MQADDLPKPTKWADHLTADHEVINDDESRKGDRIALIFQDKHTSWLQGYASHAKKPATQYTVFNGSLERN